MRAAIVALTAMALPSAAFAEEILSNNYLEIVAQDEGYWSIYTTGGIDGDPTTGSDNGKRLTYGTGSTANSIIEVDGVTYYLQYPDTVANNGTTITHTFLFPEVTVLRTYSLSTSTSGNDDLVRVRTSVQNTGSESHSVGVFVGIDTMVGDNDGAPLFTAAGIISEEIEFTAANLPATWQAFENNDVANPGLVAQGVLSGGDATKPDRFIMGNWPSGVGQDYVYSATGTPISTYNDTAVSMWWDPSVVTAGGHFDVITYFGIGEGSVAAGDLGLNVTSPAVLSVVGGQLSPNPFDINLVVENNFSFIASDVQAQLVLPAGLTLVGGPEFQSLGDINSGANELVSWQVEATPPTTSSSVTYTYDVLVTTASSTELFSVSRDVEVPQLPTSLEGLDVSIDTIDPAGFPTIDMIVSVEDAATGECIDWLDASHFDADEDGVDMNSCTAELLAESTGAKADIVFLMDITWSMSDELTGLRDNIVNFANTLAASSIDYRLGFVPFHENVGGLWGMTDDASAFESWVAATALNDWAEFENPWDALAAPFATAPSGLDLREDADRIFILATDETYSPESLYSHVTHSYGDVQAMLTANDVTLHIVTTDPPPAGPVGFDDYGPMVTATGGNFFDIASPFNEVLNQLGEEILCRYLLTCDTPNPVRDNTIREVDLIVTDGTGRGGDDSGEYFIEGGSLRLEPTFATGTVGGTIELDVVADSIGDLHDSHIVLNFDPSYLDFVEVEAGELLARDSSTGAVPAPTINLGVDHDPANGVISFNVARNHSEGTNGTGILATVTLSLTAAPPADLDSAGVEDPTQTDDVMFSIGENYLGDSSLGAINIGSYAHADIDAEDTFLLGDFDRDGDIDLVDFTTLATNWGSTTATVWGPTGGDIAPVSGTVPNLVEAPDGIVNYQDLFVFTRMWNWYRFERTL